MSGDVFYRHYVMPREHLYVAKESSFPIPLKYIDGRREANKNRLGQFGREQCRRFMEH